MNNQIKVQRDWRPSNSVTGKSQPQVSKSLLSPYFRNQFAFLNLQQYHPTTLNQSPHQLPPELFQEAPNWSLFLQCNSISIPSSKSPKTTTQNKNSTLVLLSLKVMTSHCLQNKIQTF